MERFKKNIDRQIASNQGKNLFFNGESSSLKFIPETILALERIGEIDKNSENLLINYVTDKAIQEFCRVNQYFTVTQKNKHDLRAIYVELFSNIRDYKDHVDSISKKHFANLTKWLRHTNGFAEKMYSSGGETIESVACSEYSADLQTEILDIDMAQIVEPFLDIGCGKEGNLVMYLYNNGIEAYGFDRFIFDHPFLTNSDWLAYEYGTKKWGTITSNLGFSNHFKHHHHRDDGNFIDYAKKYMDILGSLKVGGSFHYAPNLPFIEQYLDPNMYHITTRNLGEFDFKSVTIKRLSN